MFDRSSFLWQYLSPGQKGLIEEGQFLLEDTKAHPKERITDYSYLVFPFAKAYEGFLKQFFLDLGLINKYQYESDHFRIGKVLNPNLVKQLGKNSLYLGLGVRCGGSELPDELWRAWKRGRNLLFHYFPHNLRAITLIEAEELIQEILHAMEDAINKCRPTRTGPVSRSSPPVLAPASTVLV